jgi:hypothetical protein
MAKGAVGKKIYGRLRRQFPRFDRAEWRKAIHGELFLKSGVLVVEYGLYNGLILFVVGSYGKEGSVGIARAPLRERETGGVGAVTISVVIENSVAEPTGQNDLTEDVEE